MVASSRASMSSSAQRAMDRVYLDMPPGVRANAAGGSLTRFRSVARGRRARFVAPPLRPMACVSSHRVENQDRFYGVAGSSIRSRRVCGRRHAFDAARIVLPPASNLVASFSSLIVPGPTRDEFPAWRQRVACRGDDRRHRGWCRVRGWRHHPLPSAPP